jgi:hypothetical protein
LFQNLILRPQFFLAFSAYWAHFAFFILHVASYDFLKERLCRFFSANVAFHASYLPHTVFKACASINLLNHSLISEGMDKKLWMGLIIIFLMVSSIFGFMLGYRTESSVQTLKYGDFKFRAVQDQYMAVVNGVEHGFLFFPGDVEYITVNEDVKALLDAPVLTVTYDPASAAADNLGEAQYYFEVQLERVKVIERALTDNEGTSLPQKSCEDATEAQPVIDIRIGDESSITAEGSCVIVSALDQYDLYQETERVIYAVLGVIQ